MAKKQTSTKGQPAPEVLPAISLQNNPDLVETSDIGAGLVTFLKGMVPFFAKAHVLEGEARSRRDRAKALVLPTSVDEHETLQRLAKECRAGKAATEEHWEITKIANRLHKVLTGGRKRATDLDDEGYDRLNALNNAFIEQERKKAAEQERLQREEAERIERARLQAEADELERQALLAEERDERLSNREVAFVESYCWSGDAAHAAQSAGYKDPKMGARLIATAKIIEAINKNRAAANLRRQAEAVKAEPVIVVVPEVKAAIGGAASTATRWKVTVTNVDALIAGVKAGVIPADVLMPNLVRLNEYAVMMKGALNNWNGVECKPDTRLR